MSGGLLIILIFLGLRLITAIFELCTIISWYKFDETTESFYNTTVSICLSINSNNQFMNITNQFENFFLQNSFIAVDHNQSIGTLIHKIEANQEAKVIIKQKNVYNVYPDHSTFGELIKDWDPKKKIKTFINLNANDLSNPIAINCNFDVELKSFFDEMLNNNNAYTIGPSSAINVADIIGKVEFNPPIGIYGGNNFKNFNFSGIELSEPSTELKPYYIASEFKEEVKAETLFNVDVFLSREPRKKSSPVLELQEGWQIDVLVTPISGFDLQGDYLQSVIVKEENLNKRLHFTMKARAAGKGSFIITAFHQGSVLFRTKYETTILSAEEKANNNNITKQILLKGKPQSIPPDLTLLIEQNSNNGKLTLKYTLYSPDNSLNLNYKIFQIPIAQQNLGAFFLDFFYDIDIIQQQGLDVEDIMKGKGAKLYRDLFPPELRRIFWNIHDKVKSIIINSEEPWIPWEMCFMYPEDIGITEGVFLCEAYEISRWILNSSCAFVSDISLANAAFVIPSDSMLKFPLSEKNQIEAILRSINAQVTEITASRNDVKKSFLTGNYTAWHFSGHGTDSQGTDTSHYKILLENGADFSPDDIIGMKSIGKVRPIIFFNACQASRPGLGLTGLSGWPKEFIDNNVGAFIGAYWSVNDETACKLSVKFYELLAAGETIAAALKKARLHVKDDGNPTWLAYTLYADPFAKVSAS